MSTAELARRCPAPLGQRLGLFACVVLVAAWSTLSSAAALARPPTAAAGDAHAETSVDVVVAGPSARAMALETVVRELLAPVAVALRWSTVAVIRVADVLVQHPRNRGVVARVWIDLADDWRASLYIADEAGDRFLVRVLDRGNESAEVARESLARVVASAVEALQAGTTIGVERAVAEREVAAALTARPSAPPSAPPAPPREVASLPPPQEPLALSPPPSQPTPNGGVARSRASRPARDDASAPGARVGWQLGAYYEGAVVGGAPVVSHGPGLIVAGAGAVSPRFALGGWASAQYLIPFTWAATPAGARFDGAAVRLGASATYLASRAVTVEAGLGGGADVFYVRPRPAAGSDVAGLSPLWIAEPIARGVLGIAVRVSESLRLFLHAGVDVDLVRSHFDLVNADRSSTVLFAPSAVRAFAALGLAARW